MALGLAVVGLYGVITCAASQRTREMGVRMAPGASRGTVYRLVLLEAGRLALAGIALGCLGTVAAATGLQPLLFETAPWDAPTLAGVAALLGAVARAAGVLPARWAAAVDPMEALRPD